MIYSIDDLLSDCLYDISVRFLEDDLSLKDTYFGVTFEDIYSDLDTLKLSLALFKGSKRFSLDVRYYSILYFIQFISSDFYKSATFDNDCCRYIKILRKSIEFITISNLKEFI